jgi:hypothetical protein
MDKDVLELAPSVSAVRAWGPSHRAALAAETPAAFSVRSATVTAASALRQASSASYMTLAMPQGCRHWAGVRPTGPRWRISAQWNMAVCPFTARTTSRTVTCFAGRASR